MMADKMAFAASQAPPTHRVKAPQVFGKSPRMREGGACGGEWR